jgi:hypothetical protein
VKIAEQHLKTPIATTGFFAMFRGLLRAEGSVALTPGRARRLGAIVVALALGPLGLGVGSASATPHQFSFAFGSAGSAAGQVSSPQGIAVNNASGNVYVADTGNARIDQFSSAGAFIRTWGWGVADGLPMLETCTLSCQAGVSGSGAGQFTTPMFIAVDNSAGSSAGDVYVGDTGDNLVTKFDASGNLVSSYGDDTPANGQLSGKNATGGPFTAMAGITLDTSGNLSVYDPNTQDWFTFGQDGTANPTITVGRATTNAGIGVDPNGNLYKVIGLGEVEQFSASGSEIGPVNITAAATGFAIDPTTNDVYVDTGGQIDHYAGSTLSSCVPLNDCRAADSFGSGNLSGAEALTYDAATRTVYAADTGDQRIVAFGPPPPQIDSATVSNLTSNSADLNAQINPNGADTTYHIEWGTSTSYGNTAPVPDADLGAGFSDVSISQHLSGLSSSTTYHWRLVLTYSGGTITGSDHSFVYGAGGQGLPDNRGYEQVTPVQKNAGVVDVEFAYFTPLSIADDGSRVMYTSVQCFPGGGSCPAVRGGSLGEPLSSTRTASGWVTQVLAPPAQMGANTSFGNYDANHGTALFSIASPPGGQDDWYVRRADGSFADIGPVAPPANGASGPQNAPQLVATADLSHLTWDPSGMVQTNRGRWPFDATQGSAFSSYEYAGSGNSQPLLVGVSGGPGSTDLISVCGTSRGVPGVGRSGLSVDGRTLFFTALGGEGCVGSGVNETTPVPANTLYARIDNGTPAAHTVLISGRSPSGCITPTCLSSPPGDALFGRASSDGSRVFFTSTQQLTDGASEDSQAGDSATKGCKDTTGPNGCNLYLYDFARPGGDQLVDVSSGDSSGGGPRVQGVVAASPDGSHVYFVAKGVLTGAANNQGQSASSGGENLYVYERDASFPGGHIAFIGTLSAANIGFGGSDSFDWTQAIANVTPDGRFLVFTSQAQLTSDTPSATGAAQVFRYDAQTGQLLRLSLGQAGFNDNGNSGRGNVTIVPAFNSLARPDPTMSDDGSYVFFQSPVGLTPRALDDLPLDSSGDFAQNVYEWHNGQVSLISDGRDTSATNTIPCNGWQVTHGVVSSVCLMGTNPRGSDVFFSTNDQLVPQDTDNTQLDIYDARICTAESPCIKQPPPLPPCLGEACHGIPSPTPSNLAPGSSSFNGEGNVTPTEPPVKPRPLTNAQKLAKALKACHAKRNKHKRLACEKQARKKYGRKSSSQRRHKS